MILKSSFKSPYFVFQSVSHVRPFATPWTAACQASLSLLSPGVCPGSRPLGQWCCPTISPSANPFSFCLQPFPGSASLAVSCLFTSGGQSIGALASSPSASVLPMNIQSWFPLALTGLISLPSKGLSRVFSSTSVQKHQFFGAQPSVSSKSHIRTWLLKKAMALTIWTIIGKEMSLLFNILSRFVITFLPWRKGLLIKSSLKKPLILYDT